MAGGNVDIVRAFYAFSQDVENFVEAFDDPEYVANGEAAFSYLAHPDFEFALIQGEAGEAVYPGVAGFWRGMREWLSSWKTYKVLAEDFLEARDCVVSLTVESGISRAGGVPVTQRGAVVWRFEGDKIRRMETYLRREVALAAAGLEQQPQRSASGRGAARSL